MHIGIDKYTDIHINVCIHIFSEICVYVLAHTHMPCLSAYIYACIHVHVCMCVCM